MRLRGIVCCLAATVLSLLCAVPAAATAAPSPSAQQLYAGVGRLNSELALMGQGSSTIGLPADLTLSELHFKNRDGYTISVVAFGQTVGLSVSRAKIRGRAQGKAHRKIRDRASVTTYLAHGKVTPTSIGASFGDRGRIDLRFHASGRGLAATRKAGCKTPGNRPIAGFGVFAGELRFEGEGGYTSAEVHRVRGRSVDFGALLACLFGLSPGRHVALPRSGAPFGIRLPGPFAASLARVPSTPSTPTHPSAGPVSTTLVANSKLALARTVFAAQERGDGRSHFLAVDQVSEGSIGVVRLVYARGAPSAFGADDALSHAAATPPPPFSGTGTLEHGPTGTKSWGGSLAVSFLGAPHVSLTGSPFSAWLARGF